MFWYRSFFEQWVFWCKKVISLFIDCWWKTADFFGYRWKNDSLSSVKIFKIISITRNSPGVLSNVYAGWKISTRYNIKQIIKKSWLKKMYSKVTDFWFMNNLLISLHIEIFSKSRKKRSFWTSLVLHVFILFLHAIFLLWLNNIIQEKGNLDIKIILKFRWSIDLLDIWSFFRKFKNTQTITNSLEKFNPLLTLE